MKKIILVSVAALLIGVVIPTAALAATKSTTTSLTSSSTSVTINTSVTLTATVTTTGGTPTGSVAFSVGATPLGNCTLATGVCSITYTWSSPGEYSVVATYTPTGNFSASTSAPVSQVVTRYSSSVSVVSSKPNAYIGNALDFTITASGVGGTPTGTSNLYAYESNTVIGTCTLASGSCVIHLAASTVGNHRVWASYSGNDTTYLPSNSAYIYQNNVAKLTPTIVLEHSPSPSDFGSSVTLTATVSGTGGTPVGNILFEIAEGSLGSCTLSSGACSINYGGLSVGSHQITAEFGGDETYQGNEVIVTHVVNDVAIATVTTIATSSNPSIQGRDVTFTISVTSSSGTPSGEVVVKSGLVTLGSCTLSSGSCTYTSSALPLGDTTLTAYFGGSSSFLASSGSITQSVSASSSRATITHLTASTESTTVGTTVTFTANVTDLVTVTGTVSFRDGAASLGSCTLSSGTCSISYTAAIVATHPITATFIGNESFDTSTATLNYIVGLRHSSLELSSSSNPAPRLTLVTFTAVLHSSATGLVIFEDGEVQIGVCTLALGRCSDSISFSTIGTHLISAEYGGDSLNSAVTVKMNEVIGLTATTVALTSDQASPTFYETINFTAVVSDSSATGTIEVFDGATGIKSCTLSAGTCTLFYYRLSVGSHNMTAVYSGDATHAGSTSPIFVQVVALGTTTTSVVSTGNPFTQAAGLLLIATVTSTGTGATGLVQFEDYTDATEVILGTCTLAGASCSLELVTPLPVGPRKIRAEYVSDGNYAGSISPQYNQVIQAGGSGGETPTAKETVTASISGTPESVIYLDLLTISAVLTSTGGTPVGTVVIEEELAGLTDRILGSCVLSSGRCTYTNNTLAVGRHTIYLEYAGTSVYTAAFSPRISITVTPRPVQATPVQATPVRAETTVSTPAITLEPSKAIVKIINPKASSSVDFVKRDEAGHSVSVQLVVPAGAISVPATLSITASTAPTNGKKKFQALDIKLLSTEVGSITKLDKPILIKISPQGTIAKPATSQDGVTWFAIKKVENDVLVGEELDGYFVGPDNTLNVLTLHLSVFDIVKKQYSLYVKSEYSSIKVGQSMVLSTRGGAGSGSLTFSTSTPGVCSVSSSGSLLALSAGSCVVAAAKGYDSLYLNAVSAPKVITIRP